MTFFLIGQLYAMGKKPQQGEGKAKGVLIPEGLTEKEIPEPGSRGGTLFTKYCSQCHNLPNPAMYSNDEWRNMFERMVSHAATIGSTMKGIVLPDMGEKEEIIVYLQSHGLKVLIKGSPALKDPDAFQFFWYCSTCHAAPDPTIHAPEEWKKVVTRMNNHRKHWGRPEMASSEMEEIVKFLSKRQAK